MTVQIDEIHVLLSSYVRMSAKKKLELTLFDAFIYLLECKEDFS